MEEHKDLHIVSLGDLGFPFGLANIQKLLLICRGLNQNRVHITVISRYGFHKKDSGLAIDAKGSYHNIDYVYASGYPYRPSNFFIRNSLKLWGGVNEILLLIKFKMHGRLDAAILRTDRFFNILFYRILSKILGFPLVMFYVELYSSIDNRRGIYLKINDFLYERVGYRLLDGIMPISEYLVEVVRRQCPDLPLMKVPMLTDMDRFKGVKRTNRGIKYFLFCGGATYYEIMYFVLKSFELINATYEAYLYLVVNGSPADMKRINMAIENNKKKRLIKLFSNITDEYLSELYANACGLLIPLRDTIQDKARFPHKLGEYIASGNPVVTTNYGEVTKYFKDKETALIASKYDIEEFAKKMEFILQHPEKASKIGQEGRCVGIEKFDYKLYAPKIKEFILTIIGKHQNE
jgi:glycosyltransferase involved in cell wall biosynthesis